MVVLAVILGIIGLFMIIVGFTCWSNAWGTPYSGVPGSAIVGTIFVIVSVILFVVRFVFM